MNRITAKIAAKGLGYTKVDGLWWSDFYLTVLEPTPYGLGSEVYIGDGESIQEDGLTDAQMKKKYKDFIEEEEASMGDFSDEFEWRIS